MIIVGHLWRDYEMGRRLSILLCRLPRSYNCVVRLYIYMDAIFLSHYSHVPVSGTGKWKTGSEEKLSTSTQNRASRSITYVSILHLGNETSRTSCCFGCRIWKSVIFLSRSAQNQSVGHVTSRVWLTIKGNTLGGGNGCDSREMRSDNGNRTSTRQGLKALLKHLYFA